MGRPTMDSVRRACARSLAQYGFARGKAAAYRPHDDGTVAVVRAEGMRNSWTRAVTVTVSVFREQDRLEAARRTGASPHGPADVDSFQPYALSAPLGRLLPRSHDHAWVVEEREDLPRLEQELSVLWQEVAEAHVARCRGLLQVARTEPFLPGGSREFDGLLDPVLMKLSDQYAQRFFPGADPGLLRRRASSWLDDAEVCPWAPCGQLGRRRRAGGTWPDDLALDDDEVSEAVEWTPQLFGELAAVRVPRAQAGRVVGLRSELVQELAEAFGAGEVLDVGQLLTMSVLALVDWLPVADHVAAERLVRGWLEGGASMSGPASGPAPGATLVVAAGDARLFAQEVQAEQWVLDRPGFGQVPVELVRLWPQLQRLSQVLTSPG